MVSLAAEAFEEGGHPTKTVGVGGEKVNGVWVWCVWGWLVGWLVDDECVDHEFNSLD